LDPTALDTGTEHMHVEFGLEKNRDRRLGLWTRLYWRDAVPGGMVLLRRMRIVRCGGAVDGNGGKTITNAEIGAALYGWVL
jgi:hypothetical protein